ncbi:MAG: hypothetical protein ACKO23_17345, partial [Gemmataceae bacterium]
MWTPRRIVILSACFSAFFMVYLGYVYTSLGRIDGLPPLPEVYWPDISGSDIPTPMVRNGQLQNKLKLAFGANAKESNWAIRLDIHSRNMLLAAEQFEVRDGRVCLTPVSVAIMGKEKNDGLPPEIHTIRGEVAYLKFDRPVTNFSEIASRKIVEAELSGRIEVVSNRRRLERDQDLRITIPTGTVYYREDTHRIWSEGYVMLEDFKNKPEPHRITGKGLEMELLTETPPNKPGQRKENKETITGLKWVALMSAVRMDIYVEGGGSLMAANPSPAATPAPAPAKPAPAKPAPARAHLRITTPGQFRYELNKDFDLARFDVNQAKQASKPATPASPAKLPQHVEAVRTNLVTGLTDHLVCEQLTLRLKRKEKTAASGPGKAPPPKKGASSESSMEAVEIETVRASAPAGKSVVLISNADRLSARGQDFFHDTVKQVTILQGAPVEVEKDDSRMLAREVRLRNVQPPSPTPPKPGQPPVKAYQHVVAQGPGEIFLVDRKENKNLRAFWDKELTSTRDGNQDLLTLVGQARFVDEQAGQSLRGDTLKVWLEEAPRKQATDRANNSTDSRRPRHLEALGNVVARSRDMNVHDTSRLVVWFKDVNPPPESLPQPTAPAARDAKSSPPGQTKPTAVVRPPVEASPNLPKPLPSGPEQGSPLMARPAGTATPGLLTGTGPLLGKNDPKSPARPFDLSARSVEAWLVRAPDRTTIDQLWCEGTVQVRQDPAKAEEKGTEVKGDTLRMTAGGDGNYLLVVTGDLAELQTDKIYIIGPEVNIDQTANKAWVVGDGAMKMESATNFQGEALERPVPLTVHWSKSMLFNGESAEFYGNIQAVQEKARLACQRLQVYFDRQVSLKQGNRTSDPAKVRNLVCSRDVRIEDSVMDGDRVVKYQRLEGPAVQMIALEGEESTSSAGSASKKNNAGNMVY